MFQIRKFGNYMTDLIFSAKLKLVECGNNSAMHFTAEGLQTKAGAGFAKSALRHAYNLVADDSGREVLEIFSLEHRHNSTKTKQNNKTNNL